MATAKHSILKDGDKAPPFTAPTNGSSKVSLSDFEGRNVILKRIWPKVKPEEHAAEVLAAL